jgi:WD40 repeat protein
VRRRTDDRTSITLSSAPRPNPRAEVGLAVACLIHAACMHTPSFVVSSAEPLSVAATKGTPHLVVQIGHHDIVRELSFSPDGRWLASSTGDDSVKLWDVASGFEVRTWTKLPGDTEAIVFSPDSRTLATASTQIRSMDMVSNVKVWEIVSGREVMGLPEPIARVTAMSFSPDGKWIAAGTDGAEVLLWEVASGRPGRRFPQPGPVAGVAFSPNGRILASATRGLPADDPEGNVIRLWDIATGAKLHELKKHAGEINALEFSPDSRLLASGSWDVQAVVWDVATGQIRYAVPGNEVGQVWATRDVAFSDNGRWLASTIENGSGTLSIRDSETGRELRNISGPSGRFCVRFSVGARLMALGATDGSIGVWDMAAARQIRVLAAHSEFVKQAAMSPDGRWGVSGSRDGTIAVWSSESGELVRTFAGDGSAVNAIVFDAKGTLLASATTNGKVTLWEVGTWKERKTFAPPIGTDPPGTMDAIYCLAFSPDGHWLAGGGMEQLVHIWETSTGLLVRSQSGLSDAVEGIVFSPDGQWIASADSQGMVKVWDLKTGQELGSRVGNAGDSAYWIESLALSPDGRILAAGTVGGAIRLLDSQTLHELPSLHGHSDEVNAVSFSPDGRWLASGSDDGTVRLWDPRVARELKTLTGHESKVLSVEFSRNGKWLFSGSSDGTARIWDGHTGEQRVALVGLDGGRNWLSITPDGLFDGTAEGMRQVAWREEHDVRVTGLDAFFTDFYHPGLLAQILAGGRPKADVDVATVLQIPALRTMLAHGEARIDVRGGTPVVCFKQVPGVMVGAVPGDEDIPIEHDGYKVVPTDKTCKYQKEIPSQAGQADLLGRLQRWKLEAFKTPWDGQSSPTDQVTLHVFVVGITQYPKDSGFDKLSYAVTSAAAIQDFFQRQARSKKRPFRRVQVWPGLFDETAKGSSILETLRDIAGSTAEDDVVLVYLVGHGIVEQGKEMFYFAPFDAVDGGIRETGLSTAMLAEALRHLPARRIVLLVDACQSGGAVEALERIGEVKAQMMETRRPSSHDAEPDRRRGVGVHVVAATLPIAFAVQVPKERGSIFASTLLEALKTKGEVSVRDVIRKLNERLPQSSLKAVGYKQVPLISSIGLNFDLAAN